MENKDAHRRKIEALLKEWEAKIDGLLAQADAAAASARSRYQEHLPALQAQLEVARQKLHELKGEGGEAWEEIKDGMEEVWEDLKQAFDKAAAKSSGKDDKPPRA